ncbi:hypothetical protein GLYMA_20G147750v4 [Glycine max]|nr:hypothetical protein GLYMA_20G147750v4 [Glycine max]KAH1036154.1 hypothetical protein GYH30_055894 [Glycine max]
MKRHSSLLGFANFVFLIIKIQTPPCSHYYQSYKNNPNKADHTTPNIFF